VKIVSIDFALAAFAAAGALLSALKRAIAWSAEICLADIVSDAAMHARIRESRVFIYNNVLGLFVDFANISIIS
jgi:hypothetical protein